MRKPPQLRATRVNAKEYLMNRIVPQAAAAANHMFKRGDRVDGRGRSAESEAIPLDQRAKMAIWKISHDVPTVRISLSKFMDRLFDLPFTVTLGKDPNGLGIFYLNEQMREHVIKARWMPWLRRVHTWLVLYGIAPYYFSPFSVHKAMRESGLGKNAPSRTAARRDRKREASGAEEERTFETETFLPEAPDIFAGDIEVYTKNGKKKYQWRWAPDVAHPKAGDVDKSFFFLVQSEPDRYGNYTTDLASLISDTQQLEMYRQLEKSVAMQTIVPRHIIEMHPGSAVTGGNSALESAPLGMTNFFTMSGAAAGTDSVEPNHALESVRAYQRKVHANTHERDILGELGITEMAQSYNARPTITGPSSDYAQAELRNYIDNHPDIGVIEQGKYPPNSTVLNPYERYHKVAPPPLPNIRYLDHVQYMDRKYAMAGGYPLTLLLNSTNQQGAQFEASQTHLIAELRNWGKFYSENLTGIFYEAHFPFYRKMKRDHLTWHRMVYGRAPTDEERIAMEQHMQVKIFFPKAPHLGFEQLKALYAHRMITEEDFRDFALQNVNLADTRQPSDYKKAVQTLYDYTQYQAPNPVEGSGLQPSQSPNAGVTESRDSLTAKVAQLERKAGAARSDDDTKPDGSASEKRAKKRSRSDREKTGDTREVPAGAREGAGDEESQPRTKKRKKAATK